MLQKIQNCQPSNETSYINQYQKHTPISFVFYVKFSDGSFSENVEYFGEDASKVYTRKINEKVLYIAENDLDIKVPMKPLSVEQSENNVNSNKCHICDKSLNDIPPQLIQKI